MKTLAFRLGLYSVCLSSFQALGFDCCYKWHDAVGGWKTIECHGDLTGATKPGVYKVMKFNTACPAGADDPRICRDIYKLPFEHRYLQLATGRYVWKDFEHAGWWESTADPFEIVPKYYAIK